ncbi:MAG: hypothetical protein AAF449_00455 [Myxococcota bacterium]
MKTAYLLSAALGAAMTLGTTTAQAQTHDLYFAQAGAALTYSFAEVRLLYGAITSRAYDPKITSETIEELKRALASAKPQTDRATALLPKKMAKSGPTMERLRKAIVKCERTLAKVETNIDEQTRSLLEEEDPSELGRPLGEPAAKSKPKKIDWRLLKRSAGWLAYDIKAARKYYKDAAMQVARRSLRSPPRPRGKRKI